MDRLGRFHQSPRQDVTYTQNWPHEPLIGNQPTSGAVVWSIISFVLLLAGVGGMVWYFASQPRTVAEELLPESDPLLGLQPTPSQRATSSISSWSPRCGSFRWVSAPSPRTTAWKAPASTAFRWTAGCLTAVTRTWHLQIGIFWIATSWLATGLYVAPAVSGVEPKGQRLGVNALFGALLFVVVGSLAGEWMSIQHKLGNCGSGSARRATNTWTWAGSGRSCSSWPGLLAVADVARFEAGAWPSAIKTTRCLLMFLLSSIAIPLFYAAGLMYGERSNLVTAEYWRWWVVHLWVEGFFEVFATVVIAFLLTRLKLLSVPTATRAVMFSTVVFLSGGIIGTFHHLYFAGTPNIVLGLGAVFSALEVVPLVLIGFEAWENIRLARSRQQQIWVAAYKWPIYFFVAVAFWNFVGAGLFGFLINPPIALYYMQGLNTTAVHAHTALFGVYGMLGLGLMLFCLRALRPGRAWKNWPLRFPSGPSTSGWR